MGNEVDGAFSLWKDKLEFLLRQEPLITDPAQRFKIEREIEEARSKIEELSVADTEDETGSGSSVSIRNSPMKVRGDLCIVGGDVIHRKGNGS